MLWQQQRIRGQRRGQQGLHVHARHQQAIGVGDFSAQRQRAGGVVHDHTRKRQLALLGIVAAVVKLNAHGDLVAIHLLVAAGLQITLELHQVIAGLGEVHIHGVQLHDGGERSRLVGRHQCTGRDSRQSNAATNGGLNAAVFKVDARSVQIGLGHRHIGCRLCRSRLAFIKRLLADGINLHQLRIAACRCGQRALAGLGLGHGSNGAGFRGL